MSRNSQRDGSHWYESARAAKLVVCEIRYSIDQLAFEQYASALDPRCIMRIRRVPSARRAECAQGGKRESGMDQAGEVTFNTDPAADIDELFYAPFHRIANDAVDDDRGLWQLRFIRSDRAAALAVRKDLMTQSRADGSDFRRRELRYHVCGSYCMDLPDPLQACPGYQYPVECRLSPGYHHTVRLCLCFR